MLLCAMTCGDDVHHSQDDTLSRLFLILIMITHIRTSCLMMEFYAILFPGILTVNIIPYIHHHLWHEVWWFNHVGNSALPLLDYPYGINPTNTLTAEQVMEAGLCQVTATHTPAATCFQGYHAWKSPAWQCTLVSPQQTQQYAGRGTKTSGTAHHWKPPSRPTWGKGGKISGRLHLCPAPALTCFIMCLDRVVAYKPVHHLIWQNITYYHSLTINFAYQNIPY